LRSKTKLSPEIFSGHQNFQWLDYRVIPVLFIACSCCGYLTCDQNILIDTTHINEVIAKHFFFILRSKRK